jgi:membrane dipeptidase
MKIAVRQLHPGSILPGYRDAAVVYGLARGQLAYYEALTRAGEAVVLRTSPQLAAHTQQWEAADDVGGLPVGFVIGLESADPIPSPDGVREWWEHGVRVVSLTHYGPSRYAWGTGTTGGLTAAGTELLREMDGCGMILDLTHISDESFWGAVDAYPGAVIASHQNCPALCPGQRQFSDEQLRVIIDRGGVVGASMDTWMLFPEATVDWAATGDYRRRDHFPREAVTLQHVADHIDHVCELAGNSLHAAIGGDTDGQGGVDGAPLEIDSVVDYHQLETILEARGYSRPDIENVMYRNWQRFYEEHLPQ